MTGTWQPTFTDLDVPQPATTEIEKAARLTLHTLHEQGLLHPEHALICQLILDLSRVIGRGVAAGRAAAVALAAKQLVEAVDSLPKPEVGTSTAWDELVQELASA